MAVALDTSAKIDLWRIESSSGNDHSLPSTLGFYDICASRFDAAF